MTKEIDNIIDNELAIDIYESRINKELLRTLLEHLDELPDNELEAIKNLLQLKVDR